MPRNIDNETKSLIHLNLMQGVGSKTVQQLLDIFGSAEEALKHLRISKMNFVRKVQKPHPD